MGHYEPLHLQICGECYISFCDISGLKIRRKTCSTDSGKTSWWFVIHADEAVLCELDTKLESVNLQTSWLLKSCSKPAVAIAEEDPLVGDIEGPPEGSRTGEAATFGTCPNAIVSADTSPSPHCNPITPSSLNPTVQPLPTAPFRRNTRDSVTSKSVNTVTKVNYLHFNARSHLPKLDNLKLECNELNPHIVCISETWLDNAISDNELTIVDYKLVRLDRNRHGGGVAIYIHVDFTYNVICAGNYNLKCIIVSVVINSCKLCICLLYRPPNSSFDVLDSMHDILCDLDVSLFSHFILVGDLKHPQRYFNGGGGIIFS